MYKIKFFPEHNLVILKLHNKADGAIAEIFTKADDYVLNHPDYRPPVNVIIDYRDATLPSNEFFYNDLSRTLKIKTKANILVRIIPEDMKIYKSNLNIFKIFYKGEKFRETTHTKYDVPSALEAAGVTENLDQLYDFLDTQ
ncbi:MAG: hypothetical protein C0603_09125 [Denitrovibrio sp.]|nr:MAG: hypothetical protein C0603_09125 [Denitrovibrio sp.]